MNIYFFSPERGIAAHTRSNSAPWTSGSVFCSLGAGAFVARWLYPSHQGWLSRHHPQTTQTFSGVFSVQKQGRRLRAALQQGHRAQRVALLGGFSHTDISSPTARTSRFTGKHAKSQLTGKLPAKRLALPVISHIPLAARQRLFNASFMHLFTLIRDYVAECESRNSSAIPR